MISLKTGRESCLGELKKLGCFDIQLYNLLYKYTFPLRCKYINSFSRFEFNTRVSRSVVRYDKYLDKISNCFEFVHLQYKPSDELNAFLFSKPVEPFV